MKQTRKQKTRSYANKIRLKLGGRARDPRWMWWTENVSGESSADPGRSLGAL